MPISYARSLTGHERTPGANRHLGVALAFVAGAINAGGFLAVREYTSHMTGIVSSAADHLVLGDTDLVLAALGALLSFLLGAACTAILVNYIRRRGLHSGFALPLLLEAVLLLVFGILGARLAGIDAFFIPLTVMLLCFMMGLQNAVMTKVSHAEIRTTHMTGIVTDIGIELGKMAYWNADGPLRQPKVTANLGRLMLMLSLLGAFFLGGVVGALGFKHLGYLSTVPLAAFLCVLAIVPVVDDAVRVLGGQGGAGHDA
ncbi:membrane protein [Massilia aurea]|uniref:Membrane protein n=1 Tax=Massilia aurea TaxID=373040 RepID=A0A422QDW2_9BURK|nr:YoaK family protein [Massilia aurea]RNF28016.1 membrane protein [Massilia aurea]